MKRLSAIIVTAMMAGSVYGAESDSITCHITGTVIGRPDCKEIAIMESCLDFRVNKYTSVKVEDGKFSYTMREDVPRSYRLFFPEDIYKYGSWRNIPFISGNGEVEAICYDREREDSSRIVSSIPENLLAKRFEDAYNKEYGAEQRTVLALIDSLYANGTAYTPEYKHLMDQAEAAPAGAMRDSLNQLLIQYSRRPKNERFSPEHLMYDNQSMELFSKKDSMTRVFITENPSVFGLDNIKKVLLFDNPVSDIEDYINIFETVYKKNMPGHPYIADIEQMIEAKSVKTGNRYPDYGITRTDGSTERISSLINGNVAVIDLWASWCGPCRRHSMELIPLYEKYKDRGFKVVAIARENGSTAMMDAAMTKDGYPWESFVDLNDNDRVWRRNGASNSGGKIILVGADGIIVGTDISTEEIENYLVNHYGN